MPGRRLSDSDMYDVELITPLNDEIGLMCQLYRPPKQEPSSMTKRITEFGPSVSRRNAISCNKSTYLLQEAAQQRMAKLQSLK